MIYLLSLLTSLCIQFVAVDIPYNFSTVNTNNYTTVTTLWEDLVGRGFNVDPDYMIVVYRANQSRQYYVYYPNEPFNQQQSSISLSGRNESTGVLNVSMTNWRRFTYTNLNSYYNLSENSSLGSCSFQLDDGTNWGNSTNIIIWNARYSLPFNNTDTFNWSNDISGGLGSLSGLGSMSGSGHSSGSSPFEELENSSFNWASMTGHSSGGVVGPSPHSSSTHFSSTTPNPDSNDSKTDSLLYMVGNKLADITENTGALGDVLGGIMYNQISGASSLFNAISGFNDNFVAAFTPPTKEEFSAMLHTSEIYASYQNVSSSVTAMTTTLNSVGQQSGYVWEISLPESWGGNLSFNFSNYLDNETLNFIRILIGALLIISTVVFVAHQFPDIIGGGSGGENA